VNDLALGSIVLALAAVPAALLVLLLADVVKLDGAGRRQRWIRRSARPTPRPSSMCGARSHWPPFE